MHSADDSVIYFGNLNGHKVGILMGFMVSMVLVGEIL